MKTAEELFAALDSMFETEEFDYVLHAKKAQKPHWFLPEVHMKKALVLMKLGRYAESQAEYKRAHIAEQQAAMLRDPAR